MSGEAGPGATGGGTRLGFVVPSSNLQVEPLSCRVLAHLPRCTAHFSRLGVETVGTDEASARQFTLEGLEQAAGQLADARVHAVGWAGTSGSWLGPARDEELVERIGRVAGVPATTATLAVLDACRRLSVSTVGLFSPYTDDVVLAIERNLASRGVEVAGEVHLGIADSFGCGLVAAEVVEAGLRRLAAGGVEGLVVLCTNVVVDRDVARIEAALGLPVVDSAVATLWRACTLAGAWSPLAGAGRLLATDGPA